MKPLVSSPSSSDDDDKNFPQTLKPTLSRPGAAAGPPSQCTRQMEKDFAQTQYKQLLKAEALEKKKKKEAAKEQERATQILLQRMKNITGLCTITLTRVFVQSKFS